MRTIRGLEAAKSALSERSSLDPYEASTALGHEETVRQILAEVRTRGDEALRGYSRKIDGVELDQLEVSRDEIRASRSNVSEELTEALELAAERIRSFHLAQKRNLGLEFEEGGLGFVVRPLERVGVYVPGGKA